MRPVSSHRDKFSSAAGSALTVRCLELVSSNVAGHFPENRRAAGWQDFQGKGLLDLATESLRADGAPVHRMARAEIAQAALGLRVRGAGFHTTASFPALMLDAMNKSLLTGYAEFPHGWVKIARKGESVADFKNIHRIQLGTVANLDIWPDNTIPREKKIGDAKETYAVEAFSNIISFSWRSLINDDLSGLSRVPAEMGTAAARTVNHFVFRLLQLNPTLATDSVAMFSGPTGDRFNDNEIAGTIGVTSLSEGKGKMRRFKGLRTAPQGNAPDAHLNLRPKFLLVPPELEEQAMIAINSALIPGSSDGAGHQAANPHAGSLEIVVEAELASPVEWYLAADPSHVANLEVSFLQGQETPQTDDWIDPETSARKYRVTQSFGVGGLDHRGMVRSDGVDGDGGEG